MYIYYIFLFKLDKSVGITTIMAHLSISVSRNHVVIAIINNPVDIVDRT